MGGLEAGDQVLAQTFGDFLGNEAEGIMGSGKLIKGRSWAILRQK
jgi:hypothetical protein